MIEAVSLLGTAAVRKPVCIGIHGLFADHADQRLVNLGARVITTNTVPGMADKIAMDDLIAEGIRALRPDADSDQNGTPRYPPK
jgi:ribose-phosphate pyrophosphokinase